MIFGQEYISSARKLRLLSALSERKDIYENGLSVDMLETAVEAQGDGLVKIMDSGLIQMLPQGKEALDTAVNSFQRYMGNS